MLGWKRARRVVLLLTVPLVLAACANDNGQNSLSPKGPNAKTISNLINPIWIIAIVIGIAVVGMTLFIALRFRDPHGKRSPKQTHGNTVLEVGWTLIPALILAVMAVPTVATIFDLAEKPVGKDVVNITVSGRQWWWQFTYDNGIVTANEIHIPVGVPVALTLQGPPPCSGEACYDNGVNHSFWVPALNGKKDAAPGREHELWMAADEPGRYLGQCTEFCGLSHGYMRMLVEAKSPAEFTSWVAGQQTKAAVPKAATAAR